MKRVRVRVTGRVQGVWFRASAEAMAREHELAGWVRNAPDGSVEAVFEGLDADVDAAVAWCRIGPTHARIEDVQVEPLGAADPPAEGFNVR